MTIVIEIGRRNFFFPNMIYAGDKPTKRLHLGEDPR